MPIRRTTLEGRPRLMLIISLVALFCVCSAASVKLLQRGVAWVGDKVWENDEFSKRQQPRFHMTAEVRQTVPHWVVSLPWATDRRAALQMSFQRENVTFEFVDAFDSRAKFPVEQASRYVDEHVLERATLGKLTPAERGRIAAALSHLAQMERAMAEEHSVVVQFEGDAKLLPGFKGKLDYALGQLPSDWDVLYLSGCQLDELYSPMNAVGGYVGEGIRNMRWGFATCPTWAFVYRNSTAHKVLPHVQLNKLSLPFDVTLGRLACSGLINSYTTDHWLVVPGPGSNTSFLHPGTGTSLQHHYKF